MQKNKSRQPTTDNRSLDHISLLLALFCLSASTGFLTGRQIINDPSTITLQPDTRPLIPTITIEGVRNGLLHGNIKGSARVVIGSNVFTQSGVFALEADQLLVNEVSVVIPEGAAFLASTRGKKYYPVFSSGGERITPSNRIYFRSEEEARQAGYQL